MEKFFTLFKLGIKYLYRYRRRYGFLMAALIFCFAVVTFITSMKDGMYDNLYHTAQAHYAGDIVVMGYNTANTAQTHHLGRQEVAAILNAAEAVGINPRYTVKRTIHFQNAIVHFHGVAVPIRHLIGSDWEAEAHLFSRKTFYQPPAPFTGDDGIILSLPTAQMMSVRMGDSVILETETRWGQRNTGVFIVKGIVDDASIFGFHKAYISRLSLNRLMLFEDDDSSSIGFFLHNPGRAEEKRLLLYEALAGQVQLVPLAQDREGFNRGRYYFQDGYNIALYTLAVYLSDVADMLNAMTLMAYFLHGMMLLIILVSAAVTYRLILHERTRELGTMRAIGFYGADLRLVLWVEVIGVAVFSLIAGFLLSLLLSWGVSLLSFAWFPSFEIFMRDGRLTALYLPRTMLTNVGSVFLLLFVVVLFPSLRASRKNLPGLLSGEPL